VTGEGWLVRIRHKTGIRYDGPVGSSYNEARMAPQTEPRQTTLDARIEVWPPARSQRYSDYWGTQVYAFDLHEPHDSLTVTATSTVDVHASAAATEASDPVGWADLAGEEVRDRWCEYLLPTPQTALDDELAGWAERTRAYSTHPYDAARAICAEVSAEVTYLPGATGVGTSATQAWRQRAGVCQDISHLTLGLLRAAGIPARYVSGYLHPEPEAGRGRSVVGQSHAWIEWWLGDWFGFDPTNGVPAGERHIVVGRGRDYADVAPLRGVYSGPPSTGQQVEVKLTRLR
jgi:transglutaminase-like putative cysteine protease